MTKVRVPRVIGRQFEWLEPLGYSAITASKDWGPSATYARGDVLVRASYEERERYLDVTIARRRAADIREEPYWGQVHLDEVLERRAPDDRRWRDRALQVPEAKVEETFAMASTLLRTYVSDLLDGDNLELLDEIVDQRPRVGVPGLDYPASQPWFLSGEGLLFTTDSEMPRPMAVYLERSRSADPAERAVAALKIVVATRGTKDRRQLDAGHERLHEMLADDDDDVRRAAASALGEWGDADALDELLETLAGEKGDRVSPVAAAVTFIALDLPMTDRLRVLDHLRQFASRNAVAAAQVGQLAWRLGDGRSGGYPRYIKLGSRHDQ